MPESTDNIENTQLTGVLRGLEAEARQISVRIDTSKGANGSGIIIGNTGNTYTVLTAKHVICEQEKNECLDNRYVESEIVTFDGNKYPLDLNTVKAIPGVDLAVFKFTSDKFYQVAQLADYPVADNAPAFVAGYPELDEETPSKWQISLGLSSSRQTGFSGIIFGSDFLSKDNSNSAINRMNRGTLKDGYEMVYSNITHGGMSGGAVLDRLGRVIGIHGFAEGENISTTQKFQLGFSLGIPIKTFIDSQERLEADGILPTQIDPPEAVNLNVRNPFSLAFLDLKVPDSNTIPEQWLQRGNQLWRLRQFQESLQAFNRVIASNFEFVHLAHYGKGLALFTDKRYDSALTSLEEAIEKQSDFVPALYLKSLTLQELKQFDKALEAIDNAIALQPSNPFLYSSKSRILDEMQRYSEAAVALTEAIELYPLVEYYARRGILYEEQDKLELALADFSKAIELDPNDVKIYILRIDIYNKQEKNDLALLDIKKAIEVDPDYPAPYALLGKAQFDMGNFDEAFSNIEKAQRLFEARGEFEQSAELKVALSRLRSAEKRGTLQTENDKIANIVIKNH